MESWRYNYTNPKTGKGWTDQEEEIISRLMEGATHKYSEHRSSSVLSDRMQAIHGLRRGQINGTIQVPTASLSLLDRPVTRPSVGSPVGMVMAQLFEDFPGISIEEAQSKANALIQESAGRKRFLIAATTAEKPQTTVGQPCDVQERIAAKLKTPVMVNRSAFGPVNEEQYSVEPIRGRKEFPKPDRQPLTEAVKHSILEKQGRKCIYCARKLGSEIWDVNGKLIILSTRFDHFEPFALRFNDDPTNLFAACKICNEIKSDHVFDSLKECRVWLESEWSTRGYQDQFPGAKPFRANLQLVSLN